MIKIPYGIGNFKRLRKDGYYYVDRTPYIEQLENDVAPFLFMLRPRRFGKSLFASMLSYYYDVNSKDEFQTLFGDLYIGQKPTKRANNYLILSFNFSGIDTSSPEKAYEDFTLKVKNSIEFFVHKYQHLFMLKDSMDFRKSKSPHACLNYLLTWYQKQNIDIPIYLLIDEYDHFANEILSFDLHRFQGMVGQNGWVRKFYETIKIGTEKDIIDRLYVTGVSPLTLDSLTSGFNIGINISTDYTYNEMLGFTRNEVQQMMLNVGVTADKLATVMVDVKQWYNGYRFSEEAEQQIYNPNMVLHFARDYAKRGKYPKQLLDANIATDYRKISRLFGVGNRMENEKMLEKLLDDGYVTAELTQKFNLAYQFSPPDLVSLLYYNGVVTIVEGSSNYTSALNFKMPNFVIERLYYQYFYQILLEKAELQEASIDLNEKFIPLFRDNDMQPFLAHVEAILGRLSTKDKPKMNEKHIKTIFASLFYHAGVYTVLSELEVSLAGNRKGFVDLILVAQPPFNPHNQFIFELKYLPKAQKKRLETATNAATTQLEGYLTSPEVVRMGAFRAYVVVFVGNKAHIKEINRADNGAVSN